MNKFPNCGKCGLPLKKKELDSGFHDGCKTVVLPGQISFAEQDRSFMPIDQWSGCYPSNWKGTIVEESFAHPAKFSSKLIRKIYEHMVSEGWLPIGSVVIDPFGGIALGSLFAQQNGCTWIGCELEQRFVDMGNGFDCPGYGPGNHILDMIHRCPQCVQALSFEGAPPSRGPHHYEGNIQFWNRKFSVMPKWNSQSLLLQGDSRFLSQVLSSANAMVSSPPYNDVPLVPGMQGEDAGKFRVNRGQAYTNVVSSPPYSEMQVEKNSKSIDLEQMYDAYKRSGGGQSYEAFCATQLRHSGGYQVAVSSPPYSETRISPDGGDNNNNMQRTAPEEKVRYGTQSAQLGAMKATEKGFQAAVSSPPFLQTAGGVNVTSVTGPLADKALLDRHAAGNSNAGYGDTEGNMGSISPDDFWISARQIVEQVFMVLEPGGHVVWVCKDYVKGGQRVEFCRMWMELCEAVGFVTIHEHHAMLVREQGVRSTTMDGKIVDHSRSSKSFFRRIAEKKGSPPIDFETVFCMVKPE